MGGANGYAAMVRKRTAAKKSGKPAPKRRKLDDYETPDANTEQLFQFVTFKGPILEPACGSGRMLRLLKKHLAAQGHAADANNKVAGMDIKQGPQFDFRLRTAKWKGDIVTNPPYRDGLADAFVRKALELADGRVAMLMELKYLSGSRRAKWLYGPMKPECVIFIPGRVYFIAGGKPIESQFFSHVWIVWPPRAKRKANKITLTHWAAEPDEAEPDFG